MMNTTTPTTSTWKPVNRLEQLQRTPTVTHPSVNVGEEERWVSLVGGGLLLAYGLLHRTLGGLALATLGGGLLYRGASGHCHLYALLDIDKAERHPPQTAVPAGHGIKIDKSITILRELSELYTFWRNFENLPHLLSHVKSVRTDGSQRSHWVVQGPLGHRVEWDAEIINEKKDELIAWRSLAGTEVDNTGSVHFTRAPGGRGTEVRVVLKYDPPAGVAGSLVAWLFGKDPGRQVEEDLRQFKQIMESGAAPIH